MKKEYRIKRSKPENRESYVIWKLQTGDSKLVIKKQNFATHKKVK